MTADTPASTRLPVRLKLFHGNDTPIGMDFNDPPMNITAIAQGFEVYVIADACGDVSTEAHEHAMDRMVQAGAQPMTSLQYLLELQRDWARSETYDMTTGIARKFGGAYGLGIIYAKTMFNAHEG